MAKPLGGMAAPAHLVVVVVCCVLWVVFAGGTDFSVTVVQIRKPLTKKKVVNTTLNTTWACTTSLKIPRFGWRGI